MKTWGKKRYVFTIIGIVLCLSAMMVFNHISYYTSIMEKMKNMGMGSIRETKEKVEKCLTEDIEVVQSIVFSLEYMLEKNAPIEEIKDFLVYESNRYMEELDNGFTGVYGYVNGEFIDGTGWISDADYVPKEREWYIAAKEAQGEIVVVSPYLDVKTNTIKMSISKLCADEESVIAIDIAFGEIQDFVESAETNNSGYAFVMDDDGQVISHSDINEIGKNYLDDAQFAGVLPEVFSNEQSYFKTQIGNKEYQICASKVMDNWYVVMVLDTNLFFKDVKITLVRNLLLYGIISALIVFFYIYSFRRIQHFMKLERESNDKLERTNINVIRALVRTIDAKDRYTNGHSVRVAEYAMEMAKRLGKSTEEQKVIYYAGLLHDVGKIRVPVEIINKPDKLTDEEFNQVKIHPVTGYHILKDIYDDKQIAMGVKFHHERYDGKGYPSGLTEKNIPEMARILGVADSYDAMTSNRSYRDALSQETAREEIKKGKGTQFDPEMADIMLQMIEEDKEYHLREKRSSQKTVLIIDDDPINIKMVELFMKDEPACKIVSASGGKEALRLLDEISVQLIVLDVEMPEMNGFETLSRIREKYDIPVIFMSGDKDINTLQKTVELGVVDYISKPFNALTLREIMHSILNE